ncbi:hypothetical protein ACWEKT_32030 [Nocardia takedensis]
MAVAQFDEISTYVTAAHTSLPKVNDSTQTELHRLISEAHQLTGWLMFDAGRLAMADRAFAASRRAAERANAMDLMAYIGGPNSAFMSTWSGDPASGAEKAYGAVAWARRSGNRRLSAFVLTMAARAHARLGEGDLCTALLLEAEAELASHRPSQPDPVWLEVFDEAALAGHRGSCLLDLGHHADGIKALREQSAGSAEQFVRNSTIWALEQAEAHRRLGDYDAALLSIEETMDRLTGAAMSPRVHRLFRAIELAMRDDEDPMLAGTVERLRDFIAVNG